MIGIAILAAILLAAQIVKLLLWSGPFPPNKGWSKRQMDRMAQKKSPWTWACWFTHGSERQREIDESVEFMKRRKR